MRILGNFIAWLDKVCGIIAELVVFFLMLLVTAEIIGRHLFEKPIPGQVEAGTMSLVIVLYLGLAYTQLKGGHIRVEIFVSRLKGRKKELVEAFSLFLCLVPSLIVLWATWKKAWVSFKGGEFASGIINFPIWPGRCAVTFGFAILSLTIVIQIYNHIAAALGYDKGAGEG